MKSTTLLMVLLAAWAAAVPASSQEYQIGPGDVLDVEFWQDATLNATVRVSSEGMISMDIVGEVEAAGKTPRELQDEIVRLMSRLNQRISQAVVRVREYNYLYVFVSGQVGTPGKQTFERIPDLWTVINEAGGVAETGDLSRVTIIRGGEDAGKVEVVNVAAAIAEGRVNDLPKLRRGDTVDIPRTPIGLPSVGLAQSGATKNLFYVIGAVGTPGPQEYQANTDLLEAVALAGGPTDDADLRKVQVVTKDGLYGQAMTVNLEQYTQEGRPIRYILNKEDIVVLPRKAGFFSGLNIATVATIVGVISTSVLVYTSLNDGGRN